MSTQTNRNNRNTTTNHLTNAALAKQVKLLMATVANLQQAIVAAQPTTNKVATVSKTSTAKKPVASPAKKADVSTKTVATHSKATHSKAAPATRTRPQSVKAMGSSAPKAAFSSLFQVIRGCQVEWRSKVGTEDTYTWLTVPGKPNQDVIDLLHDTGLHGVKVDGEWLWMAKSRVDAETLSAVLEYL